MDYLYLTMTAFLVFRPLVSKLYTLMPAKMPKTRNEVSLNPTAEESTQPTDSLVSPPSNEAALDPTAEESTQPTDSTSRPKTTHEQDIALLLFLEATRPAIFPKPAPIRHCHCPQVISGSRCLDERPETTLNFYEAVALLNNLDKICSLPLVEKRQLVNWCLESVPPDGRQRADGAGGGWRLTTSCPAVLTPKTWSEITKLYHMCLIYTSISLEICVQIADQMRQTGVLVPVPYEPPLPHRYAATERQVRRGGRCSESVVHRFGKLVWQLVYSDDLYFELSCRTCKVYGMDWDWLMAFAKDIRANEEPGTEIDLLDVGGRPMGGFRLVTNAEGEEEGELEMLLSPYGIDPRRAEGLGSKNAILGRLTEAEVRKAEIAAVAAGCQALPPAKPRVPTELIVATLKTTDAVLRKAEKFRTRAEAWAKHLKGQRMAESSSHGGGAELGESVNCARSHGGGLGLDEDDSYCPVSNWRDATNEARIKKKRVTTMAIDKANNMPKEQASNLQEALDDS